MSKVSKVYNNNFKVKVALEAIKGEKTLQDLAALHGVSSKQIGRWKQAALEGISNCFSDKKSKDISKQESDIKTLHSKIGELVVERDFLLRASNRLS
jgi:transposase